MEKTIREEEINKLSKLIDLTNKQYGNLEVNGIHKRYKTPNGTNRILWDCTCKCGKTVIVDGASLRSGHTSSCGCLSSRTTVQDRNRTHGKSNTRLYSIWCGMHSRCYNQNRRSYHHYGAKGITVCQEWHDYITFERWALANGYTDTLTIERLDVEGNYEPSNCCWISKSQQSDNRSTSLIYSYNGKTQNLMHWSKESGIKYSTLYARLKVYGMDFETAITLNGGAML